MRAFQQPVLLYCVLQMPATDGHLVQYELKIPHLHGAVQPARSLCFLDGQPVQLTEFAESCIAAHFDGPKPHNQTEHCSCSHKNSLMQPCNVTKAASDKDEHGAVTSVKKPHHAQQDNACRMQPCHEQHPQHCSALQPSEQISKSGILIKLHKAQPSKAWDKLAGQAPVLTSAKQLPPSPDAMAALRRRLMRQRQQRTSTLTQQLSKVNSLPAPVTKRDKDQANGYLDCSMASAAAEQPCQQSNSSVGTARANVTALQRGKHGRHSNEQIQVQLRQPRVLLLHGTVLYSVVWLCFNTIASQPNSLQFNLVQLHCLCWLYHYCL